MCFHECFHIVHNPEYSHIILAIALVHVSSQVISKLSLLVVYCTYEQKIKIDCWQFGLVTKFSLSPLPQKLTTIIYSYNITEKPCFLLRPGAHLILEKAFLYVCKRTHTSTKDFQKKSIPEICSVRLQRSGLLSRQMGHFSCLQSNVGTFQILSLISKSHWHICIRPV